MAFQALTVRPGVDIEQTPLLNSSGWSFSAGVRFRDGLVEKCGGFAHLNSTQLIGICTGMHAWADLSGNLYIAAGTDQFLDLFFGGLTIDITPLRATTNPTPDFSTNFGQVTINVDDTAHGASLGDWINIYVPVSVGGIILQGLYQVTAIVDANNYQIMAASAATSTVTSGGAVPSFTTTNTSPDVLVTLNNHGLIVGSLFTVQVSTTVGGITIAPGTYSVIAPVTTNTFTFAPAGAASSNTTVSENGGNAQILYLVPTGLQSATFVGTGGGYGVGGYGSGPYGVSSSGTILEPLRQWFLDNFGQDLVGNYTLSPIYVWVPPVAANNRAIAINTTNYPSAANPPQQVVFSFVAAPQQMIIAGGCTIGNTSNFDPMLVRWCDQGDFTDWAPTSVNQAGSFRIAKGSKLVGGLAAPNFTVIWTDIGMWLMNYLGGTGLSGLVWGFDEVAGSAGLLSARSCAVFRNLVFYLSPKGMYVFDGNRITLVPCPVWDKFWKNVNLVQADKINMQVNSYFQEIDIAFPSLTGNGTVDSRITYNIRENIWTYDDAPTPFSRTAWVDENVYGAPVGADLNGYLQQQDNEGVYDADGAPINALARTGWFALQEGTLMSFMERLEADMIVIGGNQTVQVTVFAKDYPIETAAFPVRTYGPFNWTPGAGPPYNLVRARGKFFSVQISSSAMSVFWRLGKLRYDIAQAGRRP